MRLFIKVTLLCLTLIAVATIHHSGQTPQQPASPYASALSVGVGTADALECYTECVGPSYPIGCVTTLEPTQCLVTWHWQWQQFRCVGNEVC